MNAEKIRWWMEVLRKNVYAQLPIAGLGIIVAGSSVMLKALPDRGPVFLFGLFVLVIGVMSCFLSGKAYDNLNASLRAAEAIERQEKKKEEKHAKRSKTN